MGQYVIFYDGKPFNNVFCNDSFGNYCIGNKKWDFDSKEKAIKTLSTAIKRAKISWDNDFSKWTGKTFADVVDLNKFELVEFGVKNRETITL